MKSFTRTSFWAWEAAKNGGFTEWPCCRRTRPLYKALKSQDGLYTLTACGRDGRDEFYEIGSLVDLAWGPENPQSVIDRIADPRIKIITLTIMEGGYNIDKETGEFMLGSKDVKHDLEHPAIPGRSSASWPQDCGKGGKTEPAP